MPLADIWSVRGALGDAEIELYPEPLDDDTREASLRDLRRLVQDFCHRQPEARKVVALVYARLRGLRGSDVRFDDFDAGDVRAGRIGDELLHAGRAGTLVVRRRPLRNVAIPIDSPSQQVLGPDSSATTHVYKVTVVDDTGAPVSGAKVTLDVDGAPNSGPTAGDGKFTLEKTNPGTAKLTIDNLDELRDKLWPQWAKPLADQAPRGDKIIPVPVGQPFVAQRAPSDWLVTLVITRPPIWRVRMVGMLFDGDKCFLLPQALDGIKSVVAMHQAHPAAKVVIVGHEGGDEVEGSVDLALGRAKILADYLTSKPDDWMTWFGSDKSDRQRWGVREVQLMLSALPGPGGKAFYDGSSPGVMDDKTVAALKAFQTANGLTVDGKPSSDTRTALVKQYMSIEDTSLAAGVEPVAHGCTGHEDDTITADGLQPDDRRLEVLFFDTDIKPAPSGDTSDGGSPEYPAWRARLVQTVDFENHGIHVQIVDTKKQPVPLSQVRLDGPAPQDTTTDEHGFVTFWGLVAGEYTVSGTSRTGIPIPQTKITYPTAKTIVGARELPKKGKEAA
jgi:peptidoglycan hydrolase-like protein with peptidoglycan-binding domain